MTGPLIDRISREGPKKLLSIDGGGIRGVIALEILAGIEADLRTASGTPEYVLSDYFDAVAGTSTGAIIAAGISIGMSVADILQFYIDSGEAMFHRARLIDRFRYKFDAGPLALKLKSVFGDDQLRSPRLRTMLMMVMRNASSDSPWPVTNNPYGYYNQSDHAGCNLDLPLWRLLRASTAAPTYFPPEAIDIGDQHFLFVDGGITTYNNPAFQLFLMSTVDRFWCGAPPGLSRGWATGTNQMLLVSIGTGTSPGASGRLDPRDMNLLYNATNIPSALMGSALNEQDMLCRIFGECQAGDPIDREVKTLIGSHGPLNEKLFTYVRYNAELSRGGLNAMGCGNIDPSAVQKMDSTDSICQLQEVGRAVRERKVRLAHLRPEIFAP